MILISLMSRTIPFEKSFASSDKAQFWSSRNVLKPEQVRKSSGKKCWFDCNKCGHTFDSQLNSIKNGSWCPYCCKSPKRLCHCDNCDKCYKKSFASSDRAINWSDKNINDKNEIIKPRDVFLNSNDKYWFNCHECNHIFESTAANITSGYWCPYCPNQKLCDDDNNCEQCLNKSFASNDKAKYWSDKNRDQPDGYDGLYISPRQVFKKSSCSYRLFNCDKCEHTFQHTPANVTNGSWCPYCRDDELCDKDNDCNECHNKSLASSEKAQLWSDKNEKKPREVFKHSFSRDIYLFDCVCGHEIKISAQSLTIGNWCSYCSKQLLCDKDNDCNKCLNNSFASSEKAPLWSDKNEKKPREVFKSSSSSKYWFNCEKGHSFDATPANVTNGCWCPYCVNKTEQILYDKLISLYPSLQQQFKSDWCQHKRFDFVIPELNIIIELDGRQHFEQVSNWSSPEETQENDKYKMECANQNNYSVIRLLQEDVFYNTYDWFDELKQNIQKIISEGLTQNIYMCKNNEYDSDVL